MTQKLSPWLEGAYGWDFGESGWNSGMDQNLLKFSFLFDRNVDEVVASLPAATDGKAYYLTTDNRLYFAVGATYFSSIVPKWFTVTVRSTGDVWQYNGTALVQINSPSGLDARLDAVEMTIASLGSAAFEAVSAFATSTDLDIVEAQAQNYTDAFRQDLVNTADPVKGAALVGYKGRSVAERLSDVFNIRDYGAIGDGTTDDTLAIFDALAACNLAGGGTVYFPAGRYKITQTIDLFNYCTNFGSVNAPYPAINVSIDLKGDGENNTILLWAGAGGTGNYGICLSLRSNFNGDETYYFGKVSGFSIDANLSAADFQGHAGGYAITNRFTTVASTVAGCDPVTDYVGYPVNIDKDNPNATTGASCGIYASTITPAIVENIQVRGFAFGFVFGVGYGTLAKSLRATWCIVGVIFRSANTSTTITDSIFEKCAIGAMFSVSSHSGLKDCVLQGNYAGCNVYFHTWNRRCYLDNIYFEASPKGVVIRSDSSAQFRNSEHRILNSTGLQLDVDIAGISTLHLENNHMENSVFNATGTGLPDPAQYYGVFVKDNYYYDSTSEKRRVVFTNWQIPDKFLYVNDTIPKSNIDALVGTISSGKVYEAVKVQTAASHAAALDDFVVTIPNSAAAGVVELTGVCSRFGTDPKDVLYWKTVVGFTRQADLVAISSVDTITSTLLATQVAGTSATSPGQVTVTIAGAATDPNTISIKATKGSAGGNSAIQTVHAKLILAYGTAQFAKV